jgi:cation:H+ antiporter
MQGDFTRMEGVVLVVALVGALGWVIVAGRDDTVLGDEVEEFVGDSTTLRIEGFRTLLGLVGVVAAAQALVWSATRIAEQIGLTGGFVGFTLVAIGTSLPELVTSISATRRNETDLVIGNLLGSNIFNSLAIGGMIALLAPGPIDDQTLTRTGAILMVVAAVGAWMLMITSSRIKRWEGVLLLVFYALAVGMMFIGSVDGLRT